MRKPKHTPGSQLIAAAPELLEALESVYCSCSAIHQHKDNCFMLKVEKALAKAKGETE